jgi:hypothetical protein
MKINLLLALFTVATLGACIDQQDVPSDDVSAEPRLATNSLLSGTISGSNLNNAPLSSAALANSGLEANQASRMYLAYMIECALNSRQQVQSAYGGTVYTYPGAYGLASAWGTRALTTSEARYVSACVLARSNVFGQPVTISMRGDTAILATTPDEAANYNVEEGAFYGNLFDSRGSLMYACNGVDQVRDGDTYGDLPQRQCAQPDPNNPGYTLCGFVFAGNCADICAVNGDHYSSCGTQTEAITIRLLGTAP